MWAYRDWVVDAFNDDMPFDRFTITQVAGDLLPEANEATRVATGFHRCAQPTWKRELIRKRVALIRFLTE